MLRLHLVKLKYSKEDGLTEDDIQLLKTELSTFKDNHACTIYGYEYSLDLIKGLSKDFVNTYGAHTRFMCTEETKVET